MAILGPSVLGLLKDVTDRIILLLTSVAGVMVLGGLIMALTGRETKGRPWFR